MSDMSSCPALVTEEEPNVSVKTDPLRTELSLLDSSYSWFVEMVLAGSDSYDPEVDAVCG
jgi:hypothetical protein